MDKKLRFTEIDLLRFLAAFSVMFFHYTIRGHAEGDSLSPIKFTEIAMFSKYGYLGVDLFFLISGFVILMSVMGKSAKEFVISRMVRLYPAFWACCTITFVITSMLGTDVLKVSLKRYLSNMTMLHGFFPIGHVDGVYWTLFVEMKFYFLILLLVLFKQIHNIKYYLGLWLIASILFLKDGGHAFSKIGYFLIPEYSAYFIGGAAFYLIYREGPSFYKTILALGSYMLALCHAARVLYTKSNWYHMPFNILVMSLAIAVFYAIFFLISLNKTKVIRCDFYVFLGALTYPLYLLHSRIGFTVLSVVNVQVNKYVLLIGILAGMLGLAYLVHVLIERIFSRSFKNILEKGFKVIPEI